MPEDGPGDLLVGVVAVRELFLLGFVSKPRWHVHRVGSKERRVKLYPSVTCNSMVCLCHENTHGCSE